jgi:hypothetical protein
MAVLTVVTVDRTGKQLDTNQVACAGGGDSFPNTGLEYAIFTNGSGSPITITEVLQAQIDGQSATSKTFVVPAGKSMLAGPWPTATYSDGNSRMNFTYSGVTSLTVGVFKNTTA